MAPDIQSVTGACVGAAVVFFWFAFGPLQQLRRSAALMRLQVLRDTVELEVERGNLDPSDPGFRRLWQLLNVDALWLAKTGSFVLLRMLRADEAFSEEIGNLVALVREARFSAKSKLKPYVSEYMEQLARLMRTFSLPMLVLDVIGPFLKLRGIAKVLRDFRRDTRRLART